MAVAIGRVMNGAEKFMADLLAIVASAQDSEDQQIAAAKKLSTAGGPRDHRNRASWAAVRLTIAVTSSAVDAPVWASVTEYVKYAAVLVSQLPPAVQAVIARHRARGDYQAPEYQKVLMEEVYSRHVCRLNPWPEPLQRCFRLINAKVYNTMQGPDEFNIVGNFRHWDIWDRLHGIAVPTLLIAARNDEISPAQIQRMGSLIPHARVAMCEYGSHMAMYDDQRAYFDALIPFLHEAYSARRT